MKSLKHQEGLPVHKGEYKVSLLFLMVSPSAIVDDGTIVLPHEAALILFSDRPHRIAKHVQGGVLSFAKIFRKSNFESNPPNVTFAATSEDGGEKYTVFEMGEPRIEEQHIILPIIQPIGDEGMPSQGNYSNVSLVVDNVWDTIGKVAEIVGGVVGTAAAGVGTAAACTVGEVATGGLDTAVCVAGVAGTIAAGSATAGVIASTAGGDGD